MATLPQIEKRLLLLFLICLSAYQSNGQNLVTNPDLEEYNPCGDKMNVVPGWNPLGGHAGTPDYFHYCNTGNFNVPLTFAGLQYPNSDSGMIGIALCENGANVREYVYCDLIRGLKPGRTYTVRMNYAMAMQNGFTTDALHLVFLDSLPTTSIASGPVNWIPDASAGRMLNGPNAWDTISFQYTARGGEQYMVIGNFEPQASTSYSSVPPPGISPLVFMFIDDIELIEPSVNLGADQLLCIGDTIILDPLKRASAYLWSDGSTDSTLLVTQPGTYWIQLTDSNGLSYDTVEITADSLPLIDLGPDTSMCRGRDTILFYAGPGFDSYRWRFFATDSIYAYTFNWTFFSGGWKDVSVVAQHRCGEATDTVRVYVDSIPRNFLPPDLNGCAGDSFLVQVPLSLDSIQWMDGDTSRNRWIDTSALYSMSAVHECGIAFDSFEADFIPQPVVTSFADDTICSGDSMLLVNTGTGTMVWNTGSIDSFLWVETGGTYWLNVYNSCDSVYDTAQITEWGPPDPQLGPDRILCAGDSILLDSGPADSLDIGQTYLWQDGSSDTFFLLISPGLYWLEMANQCDTVRDSVFISADTLPLVSIGSDTIICPGNEVVLRLPPSYFLDSWSDGNLTDSLIANTAGLYWLEVQDSCKLNRDSLRVDTIATASVNLGPDSFVCIGDTILLNPVFSDTLIGWQDGSSDTTFEVSDGGWYWLDVAGLCGTVRDSVFIAERSFPSFKLGPDSLLCLGETLTLSADTGADGWLWQDGSATSYFVADQTGWYWAISYNSCDSVRDSVFLEFNPCDSIQFNEPCYYHFPNAFGPNMTPPDDAFRMLTNCDFSDFDMRIYNRWGNTIFRTSDNDAGWSGESGSGRTGLGTYVYYVSFIDKEGERVLKKGSVTLIR